MFSTFNIIRASVYCTLFSSISLPQLDQHFTMTASVFTMQYYLLGHRGTLSERA
jgi:hypothetical protein